MTSMMTEGPPLPNQPEQWATPGDRDILLLGGLVLVHEKIYSVPSDSGLANDVVHDVELHPTLPIHLPTDPHDDAYVNDPPKEPSVSVSSLFDSDVSQYMRTLLDRVMPLQSPRLQGIFLDTARNPVLFLLSKDFRFGGAKQIREFSFSLEKRSNLIQIQASGFMESRSGHYAVCHMVRAYPRQQTPDTVVWDMVPKSNIHKYTPDRDDQRQFFSSVRIANNRRARKDPSYRP